MNEFINKQSALDLVRDKCLEILDRCDSHYDVDIEDYVYDDPTVFNTILTCNKEIRNALSEMPTIDAEPQWIPCSERLPEDDRSKVVTLANGNAEVGYYSNGDWWCVGDKLTLENPTVIAWMPLPKPYEVKE